MEFTKNFVIQLFHENDLNEILKRYTKKDLIEMYVLLYDSKLLTSLNKERIAQEIWQYIVISNRAKKLLG